MRLDNWADYIVEKSKLGWDLSNMIPDYFSGDAHGDAQDKYPTYEKHEQVEGLRVKRVGQDELGDISSIEFKMMGWEDVDEENQAYDPFDKVDNTTRIIGLRTTRDCFQQRTFKTIRFIYITLDKQVCGKLEPLTQAYAN